MYFDFLFQNYEGILSLTKRKAQVLTYFSIVGLAMTVILTVVFALDIDDTKYIPGLIVLGSMFALKIILLIQGSYRSAVRVLIGMPLALYFLYINSYYSVTDNQLALTGLLSFCYAGLLYLSLFSYSVWLLIYHYLASAVTILYYCYERTDLSQITLWNENALFGSAHPIVELTIMLVVFVSVFFLLKILIDKTDQEFTRQKGMVTEMMRQSNFAIMALKVQRDERGEKSGMIIERTNHYFDKVFKVTKSELIGIDFSVIFPKLFRNSFNWQEKFFHAPKSGFNVCIHHLDKHFSVFNIFPEKDSIISLFFGITDFKNEIEKLKRREQRLTNLMGSLPDIFFIIEKDGTYVDYVSNNPELLKLGHEDIIGKSIFEMGFSKAMSYQIYSSIQHVIEQDNIETIEYGMNMPSGKVLVFEMRLARLSDDQVISIGRDITLKKDIEQRLEEAKEKAEEAKRLKVAFIGNISHEMRTPMNAIIGFAQMASSDTYNEQDKKNFLNIVNSNADHLMGMVSDMIDISEIESNNVDVKLRPCRINELFYKLYEKYMYRLKMSDNTINFEVEIADNASKFEIITDDHLLLKIMNQLLDNAIKYTENGKVLFGYRKEGEKVKIFVKDTGIGIEEKDQEVIFDFFHQLDNRLTKKYPGTGAGLNIVKSYVEMLGSNIEFETKPGKGSEFFFLVPITPFLKVERN